MGGGIRGKRGKHERKRERRNMLSLAWRNFPLHPPHHRTSPSKSGGDETHALCTKLVSCVEEKRWRIRIKGVMWRCPVGVSGPWCAPSGLNPTKVVPRSSGACLCSLINCMSTQTLVWRGNSTGARMHACEPRKVC